MGVQEERIKKEAIHMITTGETIRQIAKKFKVSKSTIHKDLHERLKKIDCNLYNQVDRILKYHIEVRHLRGGESTKKKYLSINKA